MERDAVRLELQLSRAAAEAPAQSVLARILTPIVCVLRRGIRHKLLHSTRLRTRLQCGFRTLCISIIQPSYAVG
jgi:hypothetical protein